MSEKITPKLFILRASQTKNAVGFIQQYRQWLENGELASIVSPILRKIDSKSLFPTPGLQEIQNAVLVHHLSMEVQKQEILQAKKIVVANTPKPNKNYFAVVLDTNGDELPNYEPQFFQHDTAAIHWVDLRLVKEAPGCYGEVSNLAMFDREGNPLVLFVERDDSLHRLFRKKKGPVVQRKSMGLSKPLGNQMRCKQDRQSFSRG